MIPLFLLSHGETKWIATKSKIFILHECDIFEFSVFLQLILYLGGLPFLWAFSGRITQRFGLGPEYEVRHNGYINYSVLKTNKNSLFSHVLAYPHTFRMSETVACIPCVCACVHLICIFSLKIMIFLRLLIICFSCSNIRTLIWSCQATHRWKVY